jgi:hypothetical protein
MSRRAIGSFSWSTAGSALVHEHCGRLLLHFRGHFLEENGTVTFSGFAISVRAIDMAILSKSLLGGMLRLSHNAPLLLCGDEMVLPAGSIRSMAAQCGRSRSRQSDQIQRIFENA